MQDARDTGRARAIPSTSRRSLLAGASAALVAGAATFQKPGPLPWRNGPRPTEPVQPMPGFGAAGDDTELVALVDQFWRHDAALDAWNADRMNETEGERHNNAWWNCCRAMTGITPQTEAGRRAKAAVALAALEKVQDSQHDVEGLVRAALAESGDRPQAEPAPDPDANLIALCDRLTVNRRAWVALIEARHSIEDERRTEPENNRLHAERLRLLDQIEAAGSARTLAGAGALARAALADAPLGVDGHWEVTEDYGWLALLAAERLTGETEA